jgi:penicillin-binding protein 1B
VAGSAPPRRRSPRRNPPVVRIWYPRTDRPWVQRLLIGLGLAALIVLIVVAVMWVRYARMIDARLAGDQQAVPRIFGRPLEVRPGQALSPAQLAHRLNDVGYAERSQAAAPGEFTVSASAITLRPRAPAKDEPEEVRIEFTRGAAPGVSRLVAGKKGLPRLTLEAPLLAALAPGQRRRYVALSQIPQHMIDAVLVIEDRRFYDHPGVDPIRAVAALITNLRGDRPYLVGGSTVTQQIVKNTFLTPDKTLRRKLQEQFMALVLESRFTKDQILELYLNDVVLGQRGPFEIRGVSEASRIFFGKDVRNVTLAEAATIAGVIQSPSRLSPFRNPVRARERRNLVLQEMAEAGRVTPADADRAAKEPLTVSARSLENEAPYFVDYVSQLVEERFSGLLRPAAAVDVYTTLDLHLQRLAQEAVAEGMAQVDKQLPARRRGQAQVALVAVQPDTGDILALVGGRAYSQSQYNRAVAARRQPGSVFKPFVYLAAFETMASEGRADLTPATVLIDEPTSFRDGEKDYTPANYQNEYEGPITLRRALALSRNIVAIKVAEQAGYDRVAALWRRVLPDSTIQPYPSIALGVFEASPLEMATAYTLFTNRGSVQPLRAILRVLDHDQPRQVPRPAVRRAARPDTTFLVEYMMRSVMDEGTGAGSRRAGFTLPAAGKTGTTNDLRDAWFIGYTPDLLTVVWVGLDDNQPIGLSGSQAALPIWSIFMRRALAGRPVSGFEPPPGIVFVEIDKDTGQLATPRCARVFHEAFLAGTEPQQTCSEHGGGFLSIFGDLFRGFRR